MCGEDYIVGWLTGQLATWPGELVALSGPLRALAASLVVRV